MKPALLNSDHSAWLPVIREPFGRRAAGVGTSSQGLQPLVRLLQRCWRTRYDNCQAEQHAQKVIPTNFPTSERSNNIA